MPRIEKAPRIGQLRHQVTFETNTESTGSGGFRTASWGDVSSEATVWAAIQPVNADESWEARQNRPRATYDIWVRDREDISTAERITATLHGGSRTFEITGLSRPLEYPRWLKIRATEVPEQVDAG